jgi:hypothetical protein
MSSTNNNEQEQDYPLSLTQQKPVAKPLLSTEQLQSESAITNVGLYRNTFKSAQSTIIPDDYFRPDAMSKLVQTQKVQRTDFD